MAEDKNKSNRLVLWPDGKIIQEDFNGQSGSTVIEVLGRNRKNHIYVPTSQNKTVNMATSFLSDPNDREYPIVRAEGDVLIFAFEDEDGSGFTITYGAGFNINNTTVIPADNYALVTFEYFEAIGNLPEGFYKTGEEFLAL